MKLIQHVLVIRNLIQQAFENRFDRLGLKSSGQQNIDMLPEDRREARLRLDNIISEHLHESGDYQLAREETIRECVFTLFNRIAAIKVMEDRELFPEVIRRRTEYAGRSFAHNAWLEEHPEERNAEREGLKHFLIDKFDELGKRLPIYRADYPYSLLPTADELFQIITAFNAVELDQDCGEETWKGDDILGWLYENFNTTEKVTFKDSGDKAEYDKISLQSQVYTPKWVVKFLVDNTLVKQYLEMYPNSPLRAKYQVANAPEPSPFPVVGCTAKKVETIRLIDPACGSGNFLLYACEVFYDLYQDQVESFGAEYANRDIPKLILENNLYGVDLDERAVQLTQLSLYIKAWQMGGRRMNFPEHLNVVSTHFTLPAFDDIEMALTMGDGWNNAEMNTLKQVWNDLCQAYKFGSLIRVEETFDRLLPVNADDLFANKWKSDMFNFKRVAIEKLRHQVEAVTSNPYSLSKVSDAMTFLDILTHKFDVAVANPPYTDSADLGTELKEFVDDNYKKPLKFNSNLYACFIKRCCELTNDEGKVGMIHPMTFMYIKTFEDVRKYIIEQTHINLFVEYGLSNLFGTVMVDPAFYVLEKDNRKADSIFISLDQYTRTPEEKNKKTYCLTALANICNNKDDKHVYFLPQSKLKGIKSYPFIYWISDEFREKFGSDDLEDAVGVKCGITTGNNERFVRYRWEVLNDDISVDYRIDFKKWVGYTKGGPYNKWYGNFWTIVDWKDNGFGIKHILDANGRIKSRMGNESFFFREGVTYSASGSKGITFRFLPTNFIFDVGGSCIFPDQYKNNEYILGFLNSKLCFYIANCLNRTVNVQVGDLKRVPFVTPPLEFENVVETLSRQNVSAKMELCSYSIIEQNYKHSPITNTNLPKQELSNYFNLENALLTQILLNEAIINKIVFDIYELSAHDRQMVLDKEGTPVGDLSVSHMAKIAFNEWLESNNKFSATDELKTHIERLPENEEQVQITDFETLYQSNNGWEEFCIQHHMNPIEVWYQFRNANVLPPQRIQSLVFELLTDVIRVVLANDDDGVIPVIDCAGEEQLAVRIEAELVNRGYNSAQISQLFALLGMPLDRYLQERFFQQLSDHLNLFMYLPKTPFIWHITSGEHHALELYISIYRWSRDTLYRIKSVYAGNRNSALRDRLAALESQTDANAKIEAEKVRLQLRELDHFCQQVDDLLESGYNPTLDDGVGKNIAPLQKRKMLSYEVLNVGQLKKYLNADW